MAKKNDKGKKKEEKKDKDVTITVKGATATSTQIKNIEQILDTCESQKAGMRIMVAAIMTATQESVIKNLTGHNGIDFGVYSQNPAGWPASRDIAKDTTAFVKAAKRADNGQSLNDLCQDVQRSGYPNAYGQWEKEATRTVKYYQGGDAGGVEETAREGKVQVVRYAFQRGGENGEKEDTWTAATRLADEVQWRSFMSAGIYYYVSEKWLYQQEVWAVIHPDTHGIDADSVNFDFDFGKSITEVTFSGRIDEWAAPPGTLIELGEEYGPASDRYLVTEIRTSLLDDTFELTAKKPMRPLKEPAPETLITTPHAEKGDGEGKVGKVKGGSDLTRVKIDERKWGGTESAFTQFIDPFMKQQGLSPGGRKEGGHQSGGDHDPNVKNAFACDYGTSNGLGAARALAKALGSSNWQPNSYATFNTEMGGYTFRVQILWGAGVDHGDHVHVGLRRA